MKHSIKNLTVLLLGLIVLLACSKKGDIAPATEDNKALYDVSFRVKSFKQEIVPIASNEPLEGTSGIDPSIYKIQYLIYDNNGKNVANYVQLHTDEGFGSLSTKLPAGDFKIIAWATSGDASDATTGNYDYLHANLPAYGLDFEIFDSFFDEIDFSVTETNNANNLELQRQTAKIEINILGEAPANTDKIVILYDSPVIYAPISGVFVGTGEYRIRRTFEQLNDYITDDGYSLPMFVLPEFPDSPYLINITITCQDVEENMLYHETIEGVEVFRNKMTVLTGSIIENDADNSEFSLSVDTTWDDDHDLINF